MRWVNRVAHVGEYRNSYKIWMQNDAGNRLLVIPRHRCDEDITTNLNKQDGYLRLDSSGSLQDQCLVPVNKLLNFVVP